MFYDNILRMIYSFSSDLYKDEAQCLEEALKTLDWRPDFASSVQNRAQDLVHKIRHTKSKGGYLESFLQEFSLSTEEGLAMMCLAEALLRIPDTYTANELIRDKVAAAKWLDKQGTQPKDWMSKAAGIGMALTRKTLESSLSRLGEPVIREAMIKAMQMMGRQFVLGTSIEDAVKNAKSWEAMGYRMSYDVLGEGARDAYTAENYFKSYVTAIETLGDKQAAVKGARKAGVSVKLSALNPRYTYAQGNICVPAMVERLKTLAHKAANYGLPLTVDAEEVSRLDLSIQIFEQVFTSRELSGWDGLGLAVQAYQKRALPLIDYLAELSHAQKRRIEVRVVKGAYWDTEIKRAQIAGVPDYPVFTRKCNTDVSFLACAAKLLSDKEAFYPMLATHNAHSVAAVAAMARETSAQFEFQRLFGMGESLYAHVLNENIGRVSVYAPVGAHKDLLPYLVRRLLENGANSSFVNKLLDNSVPEAELVKDPVAQAVANSPKRHPSIALPPDLYGPERKNSAGLDLDDPASSGKTVNFIRHYTPPEPRFSIINGKQFVDIPERFIDRAFESAKAVFPAWNRRDVQQRAQIIRHFSDFLEQNRDEFLSILVHEAGKTIPDARDELREAVDFCRYYAQCAEGDFISVGTETKGYTGESNRLYLQGRGVFVCISPWNFPLAIFTGQIVAALLAGNTVLAKPASQTRYIAQRTVELMHKAGVPVDALHLLLGDGAFGGQMVSHPDIAGVVFTGSTATAKSIQRALAQKDGAIVPLIAETGGQNAMIVDSSALIEQVVDDVILSAFGSAGQRCSALRVLYVQDEIADSFIEHLKGAMKELSIDNPRELSANIGRIIDVNALKSLNEHKAYLNGVGTMVAEAGISPNVSTDGRYFAPVAYEIPDIEVLKGEVFGPILHLIRFKAEELDNVVAQIERTGFGLTFGIHSRIQTKQNMLASRISVGNVYINRSMTGAIVGVQPFGGMGLSGTGPKAGGPYYLHAFAVEKHISINITAAGGNTSLALLEE